MNDCSEEVESETIEVAYKIQRIDYYFKQAKNLALSKIERNNYTNALANLLDSI
ncbi:hypothetical protein [Vibrio metschnikovii]|uniref:hypothetical protein n=1 Tax=Vibrio metschnikovii TaxID=28172 RepID=UPI001C2FB5CB|nr:hypothetical protein [Vibrio metschnikovii]